MGFDLNELSLDEKSTENQLSTRVIVKSSWLDVSLTGPVKISIKFIFPPLCEIVFVISSLRFSLNHNLWIKLGPRFFSIFQYSI